jgi:DNA-directed RNA polymerase specialized sigma24 family protein
VKSQRGVRRKLAAVVADLPAKGEPVRASSERGDAEARFRRLYEQQYEPLLAYAARRTLDRSEAHDVVSETFLILWRRLDEAPRDEEIPLWLYGVARRVLANRRRSRARQEPGHSSAATAVACVRIAVISVLGVAPRGGCA